MTTAARLRRAGVADVADVAPARLTPIRLDRVLRTVETATGRRHAIDTLVVLKRELDALGPAVPGSSGPPGLVSR